MQCKIGLKNTPAISGSGIKRIEMEKDRIGNSIKKSEKFAETGFKRKNRTFTTIVDSRGTEGNEMEGGLHRVGRKHWTYSLGKIPKGQSPNGTHHRSCPKYTYTRTFPTLPGDRLALILLPLTANLSPSLAN